MNNKVRVALALFAFALAGGALADEGPFEVRVRGVYLDMANNSDAIPALKVPQDAIHVNSKWIPEVDLEYFITKHWSSELVLTYPQKQTVTITQSALGPLDVGTFKHLPPTLTAKYNFMPDAAFRPYVGAGVNFTLITNVDLAIPGLNMSRQSWGPAGQVGFDYKIADHWFANMDVKYVMLRADVYAGTTKISQARLDPWLIGIGGGYRF